MSRSTYPYDPRDRDLRTCQHGAPHRVHVNSMCALHPRTCLTCCLSVQGRDCANRVVQDEAGEARRRFGRAVRDTAEAFRRCGEAAEHASLLTPEARAAQVQADIEALYGAEGDR